MDWIQTAGYLAATATTVSFFPQAWQTIRTKDTKGISLGMYVIFTFGVLMWLTYGIAKNDAPIIAANIVTLVLSSMILYYKIRYK